MAAPCRPTVISVYLITLFMLCVSLSAAIRIPPVHAIRFTHIFDNKIDAAKTQSPADGQYVESEYHGDSNDINFDEELQEMNHSNFKIDADAGASEADLEMLEDHFNYYMNDDGQGARQSISDVKTYSKGVTSTSCPELYVVKEGETLHSISAACDAPFINILLDNPHVEDVDDNISAGSVLLIKSSGNT